MQATRLLGGTALLFFLGLNARAEPDSHVVLSPEVEVRSGPGPEYYPTSKLRQGDIVRVLREEGRGWLAIEPPPGSFSWIHANNVEGTASGVAVSIDNAPVRVGSRLRNEPPTVERIQLKRGTQLFVIGRGEVSSDGTWLPVTPAPSEVRYLPAEAVRPSNAPSRIVATSAPAVPPAQPAPASPAPARADAFQPSTPPARLVPTPAIPNAPTAVASGPASRGQAYSQYCYIVDCCYPVRLNPPAVSNPHPLPAPTSQSDSPASSASPQAYWCGPGRLYRTAFTLDGKPAYGLEPAKGGVRLYVTASADLQLDPYVEKTVYLYGPARYHGELRTYHMTASQVTPLR